MSKADTHISDKLYDFENFDISGAIHQTESEISGKVNSVIMFLYYTIFQQNGVSESIFNVFIGKLKSEYQNVPYHNFRHVIDATNSLVYILDNLTQPTRDLLNITLLDKFVMVLSMLCHDIGHFGKTGKYIKDSCLPTDRATKITSEFVSSKFCDIFNKYEFTSSSPLEEFHFYLTKEILLDSGMLDHFDSAIKSDILNKIKQIILATDPVTLKDFLGSDDLLTSKLQLIKLLVKSADIGSIMKEFSVHKNWSLKLKDEFELQGDEMISRNLIVPSMHDRSSDFVNGQIMFFTYYANPLFEKLGLIVDSRCLSQMRKNHEIWVSMRT